MTSTVICRDMDGKEYEVSIDQLRWRPSVYAIVIKDNKLLVSPQINGYDLPGGGVELGETLEVALVREVFEETGLTVNNPRLVKAATSFFKLPKSTKGDFIQAVALYYVCDYVSGELSDAAFTEDEKEFSEFPEWIDPTDFDLKLADGRIAAAYDWRHLVKEELNRQ